MENEIKLQDDPEIAAISAIYVALKDLDPDARSRVLNFVTSRLGIKNKIASADDPNLPITIAGEAPVVADDELDGVSPAARKWIARNGINPSALMKIFSLGIDEIDLVAKSIPGKGKAAKMRNVFLLKGIAAYLGTGVARFTHEQVREACLHYDAFDSPNFSANLKSISADVSGTKESGYTLTARGISEATNLIKSMSAAE